jgi:hypothetical protein
MAADLTDLDLVAFMVDGVHSVTTSVGITLVGTNSSW